MFLGLDLPPLTSHLKNFRFLRNFAKGSHVSVPQRMAEIFQSGRTSISLRYLCGKVDFAAQWLFEHVLVEEYKSFCGLVLGGSKHLAPSGCNWVRNAAIFYSPS